MIMIIIIIIIAHKYLQHEQKTSQGASDNLSRWN